MSRKPLDHVCGQPRGTWHTCPRTLAAVAESKRERTHRNRYTYRDAALDRRYGVTTAEYDRMREAQGHRRGRCGPTDDLPLLTTGRRRRDGSPAVNSVTLVVDHCHTTGATRSPICHRCTIVVGYAEEHADLLALAAEYIRRSGCC